MRYGNIMLFAVLALLLFPRAVLAQQSGHTQGTASVEISCPQEGGTFCLTACDGSPEPETGTVSVKRNAAEYFVCRFSEPGDYMYTLSQIQMNKRGIIYDTTQYDVLFQVTTDEGGMLSADTLLVKKKSGAKCKAASFTNIKQAGGSHKTGKNTDHTSRAPKTGDFMKKRAIAFLVLISGSLPALWFAIRKRGKN